MRGTRYAVGAVVAGLVALAAVPARAQSWEPATHPAARDAVPVARPPDPVSLLPLPEPPPTSAPATPAPQPAPTVSDYVTFGSVRPAAVVRGKVADPDEEEERPRRDPNRLVKPPAPTRSERPRSREAADDPFLGIATAAEVTAVKPAKEDGPARLVSHTSDEERYNSGAVADRPRKKRYDDEDEDERESYKAGEGWAQGWLTGFNKFFHIGETCEERCWFQSDRPEGFESFISPVTNPFLFEDPRSLTEVRPIFLIQSIPNSDPTFRGGNAIFFGTQGRLAITDRWSLTLNKLGFQAFNAGSGSLLGDNIGFAEVWLGPKFTFWRAPDTGTVAAAGAIFQLPAGNPDVFQDTGSGSVVPYVSFAQNFRFPQYGSLNFMSTAGYSFRFDDQRSDYFYASFHLDYDIQNLHKYYPLIELNWFHYTRDGAARPFFASEGADLANFGAPVSGRDQLSLALGGRYRITDAASFGAAAEFPLISPKDLLDFRFTLDFIYRY